MKTATTQRVFVFDNRTGPNETFDCFTIICEDGQIYYSGTDPFHPQGIGGYNGHVIEMTENNDRYTAYNHERGEWDAAITKKHLGAYLKKARRNKSWLGEEVTDLTTLPEKVQQYIKQILEE